MISTPPPDTEDKTRPGVDSVDEWWVTPRKNSETGENEVSFRLEATIKTNACLSQSFFWSRLELFFAQKLVDALSTYNTANTKRVVFISGPSS